MNHPSLWSYVRDWFPLIARSRPVCETVELRLDRLTTAVERHEEPGSSLADIASVLNLAALVASDCGEPSLAQDLCWKQFGVLEDAAPLSLEASRIVFEPVVNLSRLAVRNGDPEHGYAILNEIFEAVSAGELVTIDGRSIDTGKILLDPEPRAEARRLLWNALLADGSRALVRAGRWREAQQRAEERNGIGTRLLDGLQVAVLADCDEGDFASAADRLSDAAMREDWERSVAAWLSCFHSLLSGTVRDDEVSRMIEAAASLENEQGQAVFRTRLRLATVVLAEATGHGERSLLDQAVSDVLGSRDAHAALDLLSFAQRSVLGIAPEFRNELEVLLDDARLGRGLEGAARDRLVWITDVAAAQLARKLTK